MLFPGGYHHITGTVDFHENQKQVPFIKINNTKFTDLVSRVLEETKLYIFNLWLPLSSSWFCQNLCIHVTRIKPFISFLKCESFHDTMKWEETWIFSLWFPPKDIPFFSVSLISREPKWIKQSFSAFPNGQFWCHL